MPVSAPHSAVLRPLSDLQTTHQVLMVRPARFTANPETLSSNAFQHPAGDAVMVQVSALEEFDAYAEQLRHAGIEVTVVEDSHEPHTPDSIFPNNWFSTHADGTLVLYPMEAANRRLERRPAIIGQLQLQFQVHSVLDLSPFELQGKYLEGTGSLVLDRQQRIAYLCASSRSHQQVLQVYCEALGYRACWFNATDAAGKAIYHTNVMMNVGSQLAVVCLEAISDAGQQAMLRRTLEDSGKTLLPISLAQNAHFAGNMLELRNHQGAPVFALSRRAWQSLTPLQQQTLAEQGELVIATLDTIETQGGGGARCMLAELFLTRREGAAA